MIKRSVAAVVLAMMMVGLTGGAASASDAKEKVECLFRVYIQEGDGGLECLD
ncbi:MAG TPA: hypothetical protein VE174_14295 [Actinomycetota bacterium]|nr:hypothetical protein [Actinomycetota bacterium]